MKRNIFKYLLLLLILPAVTLAQDFDKSFLESLPEDVREELINQKDFKEELEEPQYRRPSTFIRKPELVDGEALKVFGSEIFSMMQSTLMPINEPNFDGSYLLDYGDELQIQLIGQKNSTFKAYINRDGSINIPEIGKLFISGLSLDKAIDYIGNTISSSYIGVEAFITLTNVRDIQVIIAGNVYNPGPYVLNGNSNIFHALSVAGGPSESGSYRSIKLTREGQVIKTIDLYDTFIFGKSSFSTRLRSGDIIFVEPAQNIVSINGAVKRPGKYELTNQESLDKVIFFSNGITRYADLGSMKYSRITNAGIVYRNINDVDDFKGIKSEDEDNIYIKAIPVRNVSINGAILFPGTYPMKEGDGILELIDLAGGYSDNAYPFGGVLINKSTQEINEAAKLKLNEAFLNNVLALVSNNPENSNDIQAFVSLMEELKSSSVSGRVSAEFDLQILKQNSEADILLQEGDKITIPEFLNQVYVFGEVLSAGTVPYVEGKDHLHFINSKGGYNSYSDKENIFVLQPNGETVKLDNAKNVFVNNKNSNASNIYPGSVIFVPRKLDNEIIRRQSLQAYTSILSSLGVSLASLSVLKE